MQGIDTFNTDFTCIAVYGRGIFPIILFGGIGLITIKLNGSYNTFSRLVCLVCTELLFAQ